MCSDRPTTAPQRGRVVEFTTAEDAAKCRDLFLRIRGSFRRACIGPEGRIEESTQAAHAPGISFGMGGVHEDDRDRPCASPFATEDRRAGLKIAPISWRADRE